MQDTLAKNKNPKNTKRYALDSRFLVSRRKRTKILQKYQNNNYQKTKKKPKNIKKKESNVKHFPPNLREA